MASIGCAFLVTIVTMQVMEFVDFNSRLFPFSHRLGIFLFGPAICYLWIYWAIVGACHAIQYYRRVRAHEIATSRLEAQLTQSQLMMLKMQLQPHFLFNTLHAISSLVYEDPGTAERMLIRLSDLLRITLERSGAHEVRLREEMSFLQRYLDIQQIRFGDSLHVEIDLSRDIQDALVPNMILQPFVENSFCHGLGVRTGQGKLEIRGIRNANMVEIEVRDNGPGISDSPIKDGIGLSNARSRLRQHYGESYKLVLSNSPLGGAIVQIGFPFRVLAEDMKLREAIANG